MWLWLRRGVKKSAEDCSPPWPNLPSGNLLSLYLPPAPKDLAVNQLQYLLTGWCSSSNVIFLALRLIGVGLSRGAVALLLLECFGKLFTTLGTSSDARV